MSAAPNSDRSDIMVGFSDFYGFNCQQNIALIKVYTVVTK